MLLSVMASASDHSVARRYDDVELLIALHERRIRSFRLARHLDHREAFHDFFPDDLELQLGQPVSDATMDSESERDVPARVLAFNVVVIGPFDHVLVAVARDVPHDDLVTLPNRDRKSVV